MLTLFDVPTTLLDEMLVALKKFNAMELPELDEEEKLRAVIIITVDKLKQHYRFVKIKDKKRTCKRKRS
jgi:hypothetical protein